MKAIVNSGKKEYHRVNGILFFGAAGLTCACSRRAYARRTRTVVCQFVVSVHAGRVAMTARG
jgi:hypothetical protein